MNISKCVCLVLVSLLVVGVLAGVGSAQDAKLTKTKALPAPVSKYATHAPIRINSDADFNMQFPGRVISGYDINGAGKGCCIFIGNCTQAFTVKDCYIHDSNGNNVIYFCNRGLYLYKTNDGTISNNNCSSNTDGIGLEYSNSNMIENNTCAINYWSAINLYNSTNTILTNNTCMANHINIYLYSCNKTTLIGNMCKLGLYGINLFDSYNNTLAFNNCLKNTAMDNSGAGIFMRYSTNNTLMNNSCSNNDYGIKLYYSSKNILIKNTCTLNNDDGILLSSMSNSNTLSGIIAHGATMVFIYSHTVTIMYSHITISQKMNMESR